MTSGKIQMLKYKSGRLEQFIDGKQTGKRLCFHINLFLTANSRGSPNLGLLSSYYTRSNSKIKQFQFV